jgi:hypothetical protein
MGESNKKNRIENGSKLEKLEGWFANDVAWFTKILIKLKFLNQNKSNQNETFSKKTSPPGLFNKLKIFSLAFQIKKL